MVSNPGVPDDSTGDSRKDMARRLLAELRKNGTSFDLAVDQVRGGRAARVPGVPTSEDPRAAATPSAEAQDQIMRRGTDAQRAALAPPGFNKLAAQGMWYETRERELQSEVPTVGKSSNWLGSVWGGITDIVGKPIDKALDLLDLPAEGIERAIGMAYWNELPLAERWAMGHMTYDSIWSDLFQNGRGGQQDLVTAFYAGASWEEIEEEHEEVWGSAIGHFVLDPLWLVGGVPFFTRTGALGAVGRGLDFSRIPGVRSVPILGKMGQPLDERRLAASLAQLDDPRSAESFTTHRETGLLRRLWELNPIGKVDEDYVHFTNLITGIGTDASMWNRNGEPLRELFADLYAGNLTRAGELGLERMRPAKRMRAVLEGNGEFSRALQNFESLRSVSGNAFWSDAPSMLKTVREGEETTISELLRLGRQLTPEEGARYAQYRTAKFLNEFAEKGIPHLWDLHKAPARGAYEYVQSFAAGMKSALSLSVLNHPSFVALNYMNNAGAIALKISDFRGAGNFARHPWAFSKGEIAQLDELGLTEEIAKAQSADTSFWREFVPAAELGGGKGAKILRKAAAFVGLAARYDGGLRLRGYLAGTRSAAAAVWKVGDGGVLRPLTSVEQSIPGLEAWVRGLAQQNFDALDTKLLSITHSDEVLDARSFASEWAHSADTELTGGIDELIDSVPEQVLDDVDDMLKGIRDARRAGSPDYLADLGPKLDDWHDELNLGLADMKRADGVAADALPLRDIRDTVLAPWQQIAAFSHGQRERRELFFRIVAANMQAFGGETRARAVLGYMRPIMGLYEAQVRRLLEGAMASRASGGLELTGKNARELMQQWIDLLSARNESIRTFTDGSPALRSLMQSFLTGESASLARIAESAERALAEGTGWAQHIRDAIGIEERLTGNMWTRAGLDWVPQFGRPEYPRLSDAYEAVAQRAHSYYDHLRGAVPEAFAKSNPLSIEQVSGVRNLIEGPDGLRAAMRQRNVVMQINGRATRDFLALNYSRKYGFDTGLSVLFPYSFWISRTARDWLKLTQARPGQTAALTRFYDATAEINESAELPERLKRSIRIPLPAGVAGWIAGPGDVYFDPMRVLYPLASFQDDPIGGQDTTPLGASIEWAQRMPLGMANPFATLALGATGALGERDAYVRRSLASARGLPFGIPGPRPLRAAYDWLTGVAEDPDPEVLTEEIKARLAAGEPLPEGWLKPALAGLADKASTDGFDGYRTDRMIANLVGLDPEKWSPRDGLEALRYRRGPLYREAQKLAKGERGLAVLSGWALAPLRVYPEGEQVQRGLDALYREVQAQDDPKATDAFFKQHPEYQIRRVSMLDRGDGTMNEELDTTLFYLDLGKIEQQLDPMIGDLREYMRVMEEKGYLETKEGRRLRTLVQNDIAQLSERKQTETERLEALYPQRATELSLRASPRERALFALREKYFAIKRSNFKTDEEFFAARAGFIEDLHQEPVPDGEWLQLNVRAVTTWETASRAQAAQSTPEQRARLAAKRDQDLRAMAERAQDMISREDFQAYLAAGQKPPTANLLAYKTAQQSMAAYLAIAEAPGLTPTQAKALQRQWWAAHPELAKHYGADEPRAWNAETASTYGRMDAIWEKYYAQDGDARTQRDFLALHLQELNMLRERVGLSPIQLVNWARYPRPAGQSGLVDRPEN